MLVEKQMHAQGLSAGARTKARGAWLKLHPYFLSPSTSAA